jgi:putative ABC transport system ATP-binding protein
MISVRDLKFAYSEAGFRLQVPELGVRPGEKVAVVGPSGCGKTTLINLMCGLLVPQRGTVQFRDIDISRLPYEDRQDVRAARMGLVFQEFELLEYLSVLENILLPYRINQILTLNEDVVTRARELAGKVGLGDRLQRFPGRLSQGERQRVAVCRAMVSQPTVVFGDEPTGNLDPRNRDHVMEILFDYSASGAIPLIVVTHDAEIQQRFDRIINIQEFAT